MNENGSMELQTLVRSITGLSCWYVSCGGVTLPTFQLALGNKVPREKPLNNSAHPEEFRRFKGEANLLVWCSWRLDGADGPLTSSDDTPTNIKNQLNQLIDARVESVDVAAPAWDLTVRFANGLQLHAFCDHVPGDPSFDGNWEMWRGDVAVVVGPGVRYVIEARGQPVVAPTAPAQN